MKKIVVTVLTVLMLISLIPTVSGCASVPAVEEIYDRVVFLVEESYELNALFYGCGLPVWEEDSEYVEFMHLYYGLNSAQSYEMITQNAKFYSVDEIKQAAEKVYSKDYLNDVLYKTAFDGYAIEDGAGGAVVGVSRYYENEGYFWQAKEHKVFYTAMRIYDYSTMQVHALGRGGACVVTMDSWLEDTPEKIENVEIPLVLQDGQWFLDNFTGG
ncbi:MAG: hypothetical protein IJW50_05985 [Clostridia bacterium]|nr:hypothetical protein [Clostridia bacterium]